MKNRPEGEPCLGCSDPNCGKSDPDLEAKCSRVLMLIEFLERWEKEWGRKDMKQCLGVAVAHKGVR